jgi:hypothetical protein
MKNKKVILDNFYERNLKKFYFETYEKFKSIFEVKTFITPQEQEEYEEDLANTFWFKIVEPGWAPKELKRLDRRAQNWNPEDYNELWERFYMIERQVCKDLGIPETTIDL